MIVCSHVIQHTPTSVTPALLRRLHTLLSEDGRLVISSTFMPESVGAGYETMTGQPLSCGEFNELVSNHKAGVLGVRLYTPSLMRMLLESAGFHVCAHKGYTYYQKGWATKGSPAIEQRRKRGMDLTTLVESPISQVFVCRKLPGAGHLAKL